MTVGWTAILAAATGKPPRGFSVGWVIFFVVAALCVGFFMARGRRR